MESKTYKFFALIDMGGVGSYCSGETAFDAIVGSMFKIDGEEFEIAVFDVSGIKEYWWQNGRVFDGSGNRKEKEIAPLYYVSFRASTKKSRSRKAA